MEIKTKNGWWTLIVGDFFQDFIPALSRLLQEHYRFKNYDRPIISPEIINWDMTNGAYFISINWQLSNEVKISTNSKEGKAFLEVLQNELPAKLSDKQYAAFYI